MPTTRIKAPPKTGRRRSHTNEPLARLPPLSTPFPSFSLCLQRITDDPRSLQSMALSFRPLGPSGQRHQMCHAITEPSLYASSHHPASRAPMLLLGANHDHHLFGVVPMSVLAKSLYRGWRRLMGEEDDGYIERVYSSYWIYHICPTNLACSAMLDLREK
ncbi:hypothetical protein ZWY2020_024209 [Hordeum vulgare]|nr:hypothetical protein ZWY2020_024209 [Hordeum vulgare]